MAQGTVTGFKDDRGCGSSAHLGVHLPASTLLAMVTYLRPASWAMSITSGEGTSLTHLRQLDQHGKIDYSEHVPFGRLMQEIGKVGRRCAGYVGENGDAVTAIDAIHRFTDRPSTQIGVIVGSNCDGFHLLLAAHDMFERRAEFVGKAPVRHKD